MSKPEARLQGIDALMSEIPNMLGFVPADSLVLIGIQDLGTTSSVVFTLRIDLPAYENSPALAQYLQEFSQDKGADLAVVMVIGGAPDEHKPLADQIDIAFDSQGLRVHAAWTSEFRAGQTWFCYHDDDCHGTVHDTTESQLAAANSVAGVRVWASREEMAAAVAAVADAERDDWARRLEDWHERSGDSDASLHEDAAPVFAALELLRAGKELSTEEAVAALGSLRNVLVRDLMLARQEPAADQLWTILLRHAPNEDVEAPAVLLATAAQLHGDGTMANIALQRARDAAAPEQPGNMVWMLEQMLQFSSQHLRTLLDELTNDPAFQLD